MTKVYLLIAISALFTAAGTLMALNGEAEPGMAVALFFGGCLCVALGQWIGAREAAAANQRRATALTADFALARGRISLMAIGGALMGAGAGLMGAAGAPQWISWIGMAFFFASFLALAARSFDRTAQLSFSSYGLTYPRMFPAPLPWTAIAAISFDPTGIEFHPAPGAPIPKPDLFGRPRKRVMVSDRLLDGDLAALLGAIHRFHPTVRVMGMEEDDSLGA